MKRIEDLRRPLEASACMPAIDGRLALPASCHFSPKAKPVPLVSKVSRLSGLGDFGDVMADGGDGAKRS